MAGSDESVVKDTFLRMCSVLKCNAEVQTLFAVNIAAHQSRDGEQKMDRMLRKAQGVLRKAFLKHQRASAAAC